MNVIAGSILEIAHRALSNMEILYHYCSTASFHAIVQSHALWLSSLSLSNDTMEGKLVTNTILRLAQRDFLNAEQVNILREGLAIFEKGFDGLGFCLSAEGDLLSQWRGYAGNATGVAIGFSVEYLKWLCGVKKSRERLGFQLQEVEYKMSAHEERIEPTYRKVTQLIKDGTLKAPCPMGILTTGSMTDQQRKEMETSNWTVYREFVPLLLQLFGLKSIAFQEEREWRLLWIHSTNGKVTCSYRVRDNCIIPYHEVELVELGRSPIVEVILGPKHGTPTKIVKNFLKLNGYKDVWVKQSEASYR